MTWPQTRIVKGQGYRYVEVLEKMPDCPNCENDELSLITETSIYCNACNTWFHKGRIDVQNHKLVSVTTR